MFGVLGLGPVDLAILGGLGIALLAAVASLVILLATRNRKPPDED
jgi:hypothetical protein